VTVRYYFDSNVFIYAFEYSTAVGDAARRAFSLIEDGGATGVTSLLTLGEVLPGPLRRRNFRVEQAYEAVFAGKIGFDVVPVTMDLLRAAARHVADQNLRLPDALHVASALHANCDAFVTEDEGVRTPVQLPLVRLNDPVFVP
jgi:predicted nucleic acid-binding protein